MIDELYTNRIMQLGRWQKNPTILMKGSIDNMFTKQGVTKYFYGRGRMWISRPHAMF